MSIRGFGWDPKLSGRTIKITYIIDYNTTQAFNPHVHYEFNSQILPGTDALHPAGFQSSMIEAGYTLYGWSATPNNETIRLESYKPKEECILYGIVLPNNKTVYSGSISKEMWSNYSGPSIIGTPELEAYIYDLSGSVKTRNALVVESQRAAYYVGEGAATERGSFKVKFNAYQTGKITIQAYDGMHCNYATYNGTTVSWSTYIFDLVPDQPCTMIIDGYAPKDSWCSGVCGVISLVLSNPKSWV